MKNLQSKLQHVRDALNTVGHDLPRAQWKELLEEVAADIEGHLDALREEEEEQ